VAASRLQRPAGKRPVGQSAVVADLIHEHPDADHSDFHFVGASKEALGRRMTSPRGSVFEFNPIIPLYRYRHETERGTSWDLFGGLVGMDTAKRQTRIKLFRMSL